MMINRKPNVLKGQHILAQGNALGINAMTKIVRPARQCLSGGAIMFITEEFSFRTKWMISCFPENDVLQFPSCGWQASETKFSHFIFWSRGRFLRRFLYPGRCPGLCDFAPSGRGKPEASEWGKQKQILKHIP